MSRKKLTINRWDTILIKWKDAYSSQRWLNIDNCVPERRPTTNTVGMFVGQDDFWFVVCQNHDYLADQISDLMYIPKLTIEHIEVLRRAKEKR